MLNKISNNLKSRLKAVELPKLSEFSAIIIKYIRTNEQSNSTAAITFLIEKYCSIKISGVSDGESGYPNNKKMNESEFNTILLFSWQECVNFNRLDITK